MPCRPLLDHQRDLMGAVPTLTGSVAAACHQRNQSARFESIVIRSRQNTIGLVMAGSRSSLSRAPTKCAVRYRSTSGIGYLTRVILLPLCARHFNRGGTVAI